MPTLVNASRLTRLLKNGAGFRGPYFQELMEQLSPVWDVGTPNVAYDDDTLWFAQRISQAALAANNSSVGIRCPPTTPKIVVDAVFIEAQVAATTFDLNLQSGVAGAAVTLLTGPNFGAITIAAQVNTDTRVGQPGVTFFAVPMPAAAAYPGILLPLNLSIIGANFPNGTAFNTLWLSNATVNAPATATFFGRILTSYPE